MAGFPHIGAYRYLSMADYFITGAGTSTYTAYDKTGTPVAIDTTPNIGTILNTLIEKIVAGGIGGTIFIDVGQFMLVPGTVGWQIDPNAPAVSYLVGFPVAQSFVPINIVGSGLGAISQIYTGVANFTSPLAATGTQIYFDNTTVASTQYSEGFRALTAPASESAPYSPGVSQINVFFDGIRFTQATNSHQYCNIVDMYQASNFSFGRIAIDTYTSNVSEIPLPAVSNTGLIMPMNNAQGPYRGDWLLTAGLYFGLQVQEHVDISDYSAQSCMYAVNLNGSGNAHANTITHMLAQQCAYFVNNSGAGNLSIFCLDPETYTNLTGTNTWQDYVSVFENDTTAVWGDFHWKQSNTGPDTIGPIPPGVRWHYLGQPIAASSSSAGASPYTYQLQYDAIFVITDVGGMTSLALDGQELYNGTYSVGQPITVHAMHSLVATWATTAPTFQILPF